MRVILATTRLLAAACLATLAAAASAAPLAELTPAETEALTAPLPPDDPRAQSDPDSLDVPEMPAPPAPATAPRAAKRRRVIEFDLTTGEERTRGARPAGRRGGKRSAPEHAGSLGESAGAPESTVQPRVIWGVDERVRVSPTTAFPWRAFTWLRITFPSARSFSCSGTLIAAKYVLTNGHCVFSTAEGGWARLIEVVPGMDNGYRPYGTAWATYLRSVTGWTQSGLPDHDYALVSLDRSIGNTVGWLGYGSFADSTISNAAVHTAGYPGDRCGSLCQYYDVDRATGLSSTVVLHRNDTFNGQSGSGLYIIQNGARYVIAPHRGTCTVNATSNCGPRINSSRFSQLSGWVASGY